MGLINFVPDITYGTILEAMIIVTGILAAYYRLRSQTNALSLKYTELIRTVEAHVAQIETLKDQHFEARLDDNRASAQISSLSLAVSEVKAALLDIQADIKAILMRK